MRTLFNTLCHMLQRILESIKIVFADNRVSHFLCVASIEATHFYYAILFLIFIFCQYLVHIYSHNAQPQLNDSVFFVKSFTILKRVDKAIRTAMISLSTLIIYICFIINLLHFSSQHTGCIFEKLFHL